MFKKIWLITLIVIGVIVSMVIMTAAMPAIRSMTDIAASDPSASNYTGYPEATTAAPLWLYFIPVAVGGIATVIVLRSPEAKR